MNRAVLFSRKEENPRAQDDPRIVKRAALACSWGRACSSSPFSCSSPQRSLRFRLRTVASWRVAAATAGIVDSLSYFNQEGALSLNVSEKESWNVAQEALSSLGASTCDVGEGVELLDLEREGDSVRVQLTTRARLPIVPQVIAGSVGPVLTQWSSARVGAAQ